MIPLNHPTAAAGDQFGSAVAIQNQRCIVGTRYDDDKGDSSGTASIFRSESPGFWTHEQTITGGDSQAYDGFGASVALAGEFVFCGSPEWEDTSVSLYPNAGCVYAFRRANGPWQQAQRIVSPNAYTEDRFGSSIAACGMTLAVATTKDGKGSKVGAVYVYRFNGSSWAFDGKLSTANTYGFGSSVAISPDGAKIVVGAHIENSVGPSPVTFGGAAHLFERVGGSWVHKARITPADLASSDQFGAAVGINAKYIVVGSPGDDDTGSASGSCYAFNHAGMQVAKIKPTDGAAGDGFGSALALSDTQLIVGSKNDGPPLQAGAAYTFTPATWVQTAKLRSEMPGMSQQFGSTVGVWGNSVIIGSPGDSAAAFKAGRAWIA